MTGRLDGFDDPEYQADVKALADASARFDAAYHSKVAELVVQAIKDKLPLDELPPEVRDVVAAARGMAEGLDVLSIPEKWRPFYTLAKAILLLLA